MTKPELDAYYTPPALAAKVASLVTAADDDVVCLDSSCGDGSLLEAVSGRFPRVTCVGVDIDTTAIAGVQERHPEWHLFGGDALLVDTRARVKSRLPKPVDAVVGNPPFSMREGRGVVDPVLGARSSVAMAHVARDLLTDRPSLGAVYILPESCLTSVLDADIRARLSMLYRLEVVARIDACTFGGTRARTALVRATPLSTAGRVTSAQRGPAVTTLLDRARVCRGGLPVHLAQRCRAGLRYCHSSDLRELASSGGTSIRMLPRVAPISRGVVRPGLYLLVPRVGRPSLDQVVPVRVPEALQLSDCVIAIQIPSRTPRLSRAAQVSLVQMYRGTGAPYVTVAQIVRWAWRRGWVPPPCEAGSASSSAGRDRLRPLDDRANC